MQWYFVLMIAFVASIIGSVFASLPLYLAIKTTHPTILTRDEVTKLWQEERFATPYDKAMRQDITFTMNDGYLIHGDYMLNPGSKKFVICCHGYSVNREAELEYGLFFYKLGYSVILYDQRGHGDNAPYKSTMGYLEGKDLNQIIDQVYQKFGGDIHIGLHGVSMGATTVLNVTKYRRDILWIVEDCGYVSFRSVLRVQIRKGHMPAFIFGPLGSFVCLLLYHFPFGAASVEKNLKNIDVPTLIFHGDIDESVPLKNAYILNDKLKCNHKMVIYHSRHACCYPDNKDAYEKEIEAFIKEFEY